MPIARVFLGPAMRASERASELRNEPAKELKNERTNVYDCARRSSVGCCVLQLEVAASSVTPFNAKASHLCGGCQRRRRWRKLELAAAAGSGLVPLRARARRRRLISSHRVDEGSQWQLATTNDAAAEPAIELDEQLSASASPVASRNGVDVERPLARGNNPQQLCARDLCLSLWARRPSLRKPN